MFKTYTWNKKVENQIKDTFTGYNIKAAVDGKYLNINAMANFTQEIFFYF